MLRVAGIGAALVAAATGVWWYVVSPGVASYQLGGLMMLPAVFLVLAWLHRRLPIKLQWGLAAVIAPLGPMAYLLVGGDQWWNWGQLTPLPLFMLATQSVWRDEDDEEREPGYGGIADGPWGPPG